MSLNLTKKEWTRPNCTAPMLTSSRSHALGRSFACSRCCACAFALPSPPALSYLWPVARGLRPWAGVAKACLLEPVPRGSPEFSSLGEGFADPLRRVNGLSHVLLKVG